MPLPENPDPLVACAPGALPGRGFPRSVRALLQRAQVDRAVAFGLLMRGWQVLAGPVTLIVIARYLSPEAQGYYYTFASLVALQALVELGFGAVVTNLASHEWAHLDLDVAGHIVGAAGSRSRLVSLGRLLFAWFAGASAVFVAAVGSAGYFFFASAEPSDVAWRGPWLTLVALHGLTLWMLPFLALLEGCNQVASINRFQLMQAVLSSISLWLGLALGAGLWAAALAAVVIVLRDLYLLGVHYRAFFAPFRHPAEGPTMHWRSEIWPMQSRLAASALFGYLAFSTFNPIMFHYHGAAVAGQMGMTWMLAGLAQGLALPWLQTRVPHFGMLVARKEYAALDRSFYRTTVLSVGVCLLAALGLWGAVLAINNLEHPWAERLLPPVPTGLFLVATVVLQLGLCQTLYLRAHRQEPLLLLNMAFGLAVGLSVWLLGARFGPTGAAAGYLVSVVAAVVWETAIWRRCRVAWHRDGA
jgi:O-antigen/teichoic acid export membrane protein